MMQNISLSIELNTYIDVKKTVNALQKNSLLKGEMKNNNSKLFENCFSINKIVSKKLDE